MSQKSSEEHPKFLNSEPARKLTSREISKAIGGLVGGFLGNGWCDPDDILAALRFTVHHWDSYVQMAGFVSPKPCDPKGAK